MSVEDIETLKEQLPQLFESRNLPAAWEGNLISIPVHDPEAIIHSSEVLDMHGVNNLEAEYSDIETLGADWVEPGSSVPDIFTEPVPGLEGKYGGAPISYRDRDRSPPPDCLAFYLPFHYYYPNFWGIYIFFEGVLWLAGDIVHRSKGTVSPVRAIEAARLFLYYHEAFHHQTECFATRLELTHRKPFYKSGFERLYESTAGTVHCVEEGLANAAALQKTAMRLKHRNTDVALSEYVREAPPGYDQGNAIRKKFLSTKCRFAEDNQNICLPLLPRRNPKIWLTAPYMFNGISNIKGRVNYVIHRGSGLSERLPFRPLLSPDKIVKKLRDLVGLEFVRNGGNHEIWRTKSGKTISIPRHARDLGRGLLRQILREAGLNMGLDEFQQY